MQLPSCELFHIPSQPALLKMIFLFPWWDMDLLHGGHQVVCSQPCLHICCSITYYFSNGRSDLRLSLSPPQSSNVRWTVKTCASYSQQVFQYKPQPSHAHLHINSLYRIWIDLTIFHPAELIHIGFFGWMNFLHKNPKVLSHLK